MIFGYARVSTNSQNIDRQMDSLKSYGVDKIFIDKKSGKSADRPELKKMYEQLRTGDILVVTELSRFGRSLQDLIKLVTKLNEVGVDFKSLKENWIDTTTPQGRYFFHVTAAFNELQREIIVANTADGLASARARGRKGGRPPVDKDKLKLALDLYNDKNYSIKQIVKITGISQGTLYNYLKSKKINKGDN